MNKTHSVLLGLMLSLLFQTCKTDNAKRFQLTDENSILVQDKKGEIRVPIDPQRVVLFDLGALDVFDELGITEKVVGFPKTHVPKYLQKLQKNEGIADIGDRDKPTFQKIKELNPDLIILGERQLKNYKAFSKMAPTLVYQMDCADFVGSIQSNLSRIGKIFNLEKEAKAIDEDMRLSIRLNRTMDESKKGLIVLLHNDQLSAFGKDSCFRSFINDELNVPPVSESLKSSDSGYSISSEYIREKNPDVLFVIDENAALGEPESQPSLLENPLIQETSAYKNHKVIYLSPDVWYLAGGGVQALKIMAQEIGHGL